MSIFKNNKVVHSTCNGFNMWFCMCASVGILCASSLHPYLTHIITLCFMYIECFILF